MTGSADGGTVGDLGDGRLCRVIAVESEGFVFVEFRGGGEGHVAAENIGALPVGAVLYVREGRWDQVDDDLWAGGDLVGLVEGSDGVSVVVRVGASGLRTFPADEALGLAEGDFVRLGPDGRPIGALPGTRQLHNREDSFDAGDLIVDKATITTTLDDVGGDQVLRRKAEDLARVALDPDQPLAAMGVNPIKGVLFSGPPGTGKTYLAKALAKETQANFYLVSGPAIVDQWVGQTERRLREVFEHAAGNKPAIVFFDEIDSLYTSRGSDVHEATNRLIGQFLSILDGFISLEQVLVIATTNVASMMEEALLRPGRLGHKLVFQLPTLADREHVLRVSANKIAFDEEPDWDMLAKATAGWSNAELAAIWTDAGIAAALDRRRTICGEDVLYGLAEVTAERKTRRAVR